MAGWSKPQGWGSLGCGRRYVPKFLTHTKDKAGRETKSQPVHILPGDRAERGWGASAREVGASPVPVPHSQPPLWAQLNPSNMQPAGMLVGRHFYNQETLLSHKPVLFLGGLCFRTCRDVSWLPHEAQSWCHCCPVPRVLPWPQGSLRSLLTRVEWGQCHRCHAAQERGSPHRAVRPSTFCQ